MGNLEDGFAPYEIRFTQEQIIWLLGYLDFLKKENRWPPLGGDVLVKSGIQGRAYFEIPIGIAAEIELRLKALGNPDEFIIRDRFCHDEDVWMLGKKYHLNSGEIGMRINRGLAYIAGFSRKRISYEEWIKKGWHSKRRKSQKQLQNKDFRHSLDKPYA